MDLALAVVLISTLDRVILGIGCVVLVGALAWAATFPISFSV